MKELVQSIAKDCPFIPEMIVICPMPSSKEWLVTAWARNETEYNIYVSIPPDFDLERKDSFGPVVKVGKIDLRFAGSREMWEAMKGGHRV